MSEITYKKNNAKRLFVTANYDLHQSFLRSIRGRYYKKRTGGPIWSIPIEKEEELQKYIIETKKEEEELLRNSSSSESNESDRSDSESIEIHSEVESNLCNESQAKDSESREISNSE